MHHVAKHKKYVYKYAIYLLDLSETQIILESRLEKWDWVRMLDSAWQSPRWENTKVTILQPSTTTLPFWHLPHNQQRAATSCQLVCHQGTTASTSCLTSLAGVPHLRVSSCLYLRHRYGSKSFHCIKKETRIQSAPHIILYYLRLIIFGFMCCICCIYRWIYHRPIDGGLQTYLVRLCM